MNSCVIKFTRVLSVVKTFFLDLTTIVPRPLEHSGSGPNTCPRHPVAVSFSIFGRNFEATICNDQKREVINPARPGVNFYRVAV